MCYIVICIIRMYVDEIIFKKKQTQRARDQQQQQQTTKTHGFRIDFVSATTLYIQYIPVKNRRVFQFTYRLRVVHNTIKYARVFFFNKF